MPEDGRTPRIDPETNEETVQYRGEDRDPQEENQPDPARELFDWADKDCPARERVLERIRGGYIAPGPFTTVYLLVPGLAGSRASC